MKGLGNPSITYCASLYLMISEDDLFNDGVVAQWYNPLTSQHEQSGGVRLIPVGPHHLSAMAMGRGLNQRLTANAIQRLALKTATSPSLHFTSLDI